MFPWNAAAVRELVEETGVWLFESGTVVTPDRPSEEAVFSYVLDRDERFAGDSLWYFANWITPVPFPVRFDTRFFAATVPEGVEPIVDAIELVEAEWIRPCHALKRADVGEWDVAFPTRKILEFLGAFESTADLGESIGASGGGRSDPATTCGGRREHRDTDAGRSRFHRGGGRRICPDLLSTPRAHHPVRHRDPPGDRFIVMVERVLAPNPGIYTGSGTNTYLIGDGDEVAIIDPGPVIDTHLLAILDAIGVRNAVAVIATHTHPDHAPLSNLLAARLGVPVSDSGRVRSSNQTFGSPMAIETSRGTPQPRGSPHTGTLRRPPVFPSLRETLHRRPHHGRVHRCHGGRLRISRVALSSAGPGRRPHRAGTRGLDGRCRSGDIAGTSSTAWRENREILDAIAAGAGTVVAIVDAVYSFVPADLRPAATHQVIVQMNKLLADEKVRFSAGAAGPSTMVELIARDMTDTHRPHPVSVVGLAAPAFAADDAAVTPR